MERKYSMDYLKCFAVFLVVCIHTNPFHGITGIDGKYLSNIILAVSRIGVPVFFAFSGYLFTIKVSKIGSSNEYFYKYIKKLIKLFLSWYIFYIFYDLVDIFVTGYHQSMFLILKSMQKYFYSLLNINVIFYGSENSSYHLWFLIVLIWSISILYLFLKLKLTNILFIVSFLLNIIGLLGQSYSGIIDLPLNTRDTIFFGLFYVSMGCYFAKNEEKILCKTNKLTSKNIFALIITFIFFQIIERMVTYVFWHPIHSDYFISTIPATLFILVFMIKFPKAGKDSVFAKIGENAVGVYVTHIFILKTIVAFVSVSFSNNFFFQLFLTPFVCIASYYYYLYLQTLKWYFSNSMKTNRSF